MSTKNFTSNEIIQRMCLASGVKNAVKLSEYLGYSSTGTISGWKRKNTVPDSAIAKVSELTGYSFEWLKTGVGVSHTERELEHKIAEASSAYIKSQPGDPVLTDEESRIIIMLRKLPATDRQHHVDGITTSFFLMMKKTENNET